ncbi:MAG: hypothetical protein IT459_15295 [Planctomycetes bacterium]|nr:hypothetical protein [Planctomycetota bacterium]
MKRPYRVVPLVLCALVLVSGLAVALGLTEAQRKIWEQILQAKELADLGEMGKIAKKNLGEMEAIYEDFEGQLTFSDSLDSWEDLKLVGNAIDEATGNNVKKVRMDALAKMSADQRVTRADLRNRYLGARATMQAAQKARDKASFDEAINMLTDLANQFGTIGDSEYQAYCITLVGDAHRENENKLEAVKAYDLADQVLTKAGYRNWLFVGQVKQIRDALKAEGFDPNAKPGDESIPKGNTASSWAKDPAGEKWSEPEHLKVVVAEDLPYKYTTPAFSSGENTAIWMRWPMNGNGPADFEERFKPLGNQIKVRRDGPKLFVTVGEQKKPFEFTLSQKPQLCEIKREVKDVDGNTQTFKYGFLFATGGSQENRFGMSLNSSPSATQYLIRYHAATMLRGKVLGQDITIFDDNSSGSFGDPVRVREPTNVVNDEFLFNDAIIFGKSKTAAPWTEFMEVDGNFYRLKLDTDAMTVVTRKLEVDTGTVKLAWKGPVKPECVIIEETREFKGAYFAIGKDPITVPVGLYRMAYGIIRQGTKMTQKSCLMLPGKFVSFKVEKGKEAVVELGEPFTFDFKTEPLGSGGLRVIGKSVLAYGKSGELYARFFDEPPTPDKVVMRVKGGSPVGKTTPMANAVFADYQKDEWSAYQPLDLDLPAADGQTYEVQLSLKKHPLLGGPIKSEWQN